MYQGLLRWQPTKHEPRSNWKPCRQADLAQAPKRGSGLVCKIPVRGKAQKFWKILPLEHDRPEHRGSCLQVLQVQAGDCGFRGQLLMHLLLGDLLPTLPWLYQVLRFGGAWTDDGQGAPQLGRVSTIRCLLLRQPNQMKKKAIEPDDQTDPEFLSLFYFRFVNSKFWIQ